MLNLEALVQSQIQAGVSSEVDLGPLKKKKIYSFGCARS